jgi:hypothetical protein
VKHRRRRSWLRILEDRYQHRRTRSKRKDAPIVYPVLGRPPAAPPQPVPAPKENLMTMPQFVVLGILFVIIAWLGAATVAWGVVELNGGGEAGEMGLQGPQGIAGEPGPEGPQGPPGNDAAMEMIKRLGAMFAVQQKSVLLGGTFVEFNDSDINNCVEYIITGEPGVGVCPGFQ